MAKGKKASMITSLRAGQRVKALSTLKTRTEMVLVDGLETYIEGRKSKYAKASIKSQLFPI